MFKKMKEEYGYNDEILNQFKLMIYNWNINNATKYYIVFKVEILS